MRQAKNYNRKKEQSVTKISQSAFGTNALTADQELQEKARQRGLVEHSRFESEVAYFYQGEGRTSSIFPYFFKVFVFFVIIGVLAFLFS